MFSFGSHDFERSRVETSFFERPLNSPRLLKGGGFTSWVYFFVLIHLVYARGAVNAMSERFSDSKLDMH